MADGARTIKLLNDLLTETREARAENQRLHAHTDVVLVEAIRLHDTDPDAHQGRIADLERRVKRLEGKRDDETPTR